MRRNDMFLLSHLVNDFLGLLSRHPRPSDNEVRGSYVYHDNIWRAHCDNGMRDLFQHNVRKVWESRKRMGSGSVRF